GGGPYSVEVMLKQIEDNNRVARNPKIIAISDPDIRSPGIKLAKQLDLLTFKDYRDLYDRKYNIDLIIVLKPDDQLLREVLASRPNHIRILSHDVFKFLWKDIGYVERQLKARTEEMETILNHIQDSIVVMTPEMKIVEVNESFLNQMGYKREQVIGQRCHEIFQKENRRCHLSEDGILCPLNDVIRNKTSSHRTDLTRLDRHGNIRHMDVIVCPIWEADGKISRFIEISRDITEIKTQQENTKKQLEQMVEERTRELEETHAKLLHQDKMSSLGKLSAAVVHEINNPIAGILNLIKLIKRINAEGPVTEKETAQFEQYLDLTETELHRVGRIVSNLLTFARHSKIETKKLCLNKLIERTIIMNANLLKLNNINIIQKLDPDLPKLLGSEDQLQQVIMNFVSNAVEAMELSTPKNLTISTGYNLSDNSVFLSCRDTGIGIPRENIYRLFEPFFTTKKKGKGVGLGLSVAYGIVKDHGGKIEIDSKQGLGTTFTIRIPVSGKNMTKTT
ncbi:MAG: ATP-binding protein, partial [bacterium]